VQALRTVYLIRHPETDWNRDGRYQGRTGRPLTGADDESIHMIRQWMRDCAPGCIVTSPASHARALADDIAENLAAAMQPVVDPAWHEVDHGAWEGLRHQEVAARFGDAAMQRFSDPDYAGHGGETLTAATARIDRAWRALLADAPAVTAVVSHATPVRLVLCHCLALPPARQWRFRVDNSSATRIDVAEGTPIIGFVNRRVQP